MASEKPPVRLSALAPHEADYVLDGVAIHEAGHAVHRVYGVGVGAFKDPFDYVWAHRTAEEYDADNGGVVGAVVPKDMSGTSWSRSRRVMEAAKAAGTFNPKEWQWLAVFEISQSLAGPMAEFRYQNRMEDGWELDALSAFEGALKGEDFLGAKQDMLHAVEVMKDFREDRAGADLFIEALKEVAQLWDRPGVWACVMHVARLLRERGRLSYDDVVRETGGAAS
jgi:hypothetical protein